MERKIIEKRILSKYDVDYFCVNRGLYDKGTDEDYSNLLENIIPYNEHITTEKLKEIASNIIEHTNIEEYLKRYYCTKKDILLEFMYLISVKCVNIFDYVEEKK